MRAFQIPCGVASSDVVLKSCRMNTTACSFSRLEYSNLGTSQLGWKTKFDGEWCIEDLLVLRIDMVQRVIPKMKCYGHCPQGIVVSLLHWSGLKLARKLNLWKPSSLTADVKRRVVMEMTTFMFIETCMLLLFSKAPNIKYHINVNPTSLLVYVGSDIQDLLAVLEEFSWVFYPNKVTLARMRLEANMNSALYLSRYNVKVFLLKCHTMAGRVISINGVSFKD